MVADMAQEGNKMAVFIHLCYDHGVKFEVLDGSFPTIDPADEDEMATKCAELMAWTADLGRYFLRKRVQSGVDRAQRAGRINISATSVKADSHAIARGCASRDPRSSKPPRDRRTRVHI